MALRFPISLLVAVLALAHAGGASPAPAAEPNQPRPGVSLTVYPEFAMVSEVCQVKVAKDGLVELDDMGATVVPTSIRFEGLTDPHARVLELRCRGGIGSYSSSLARFVGKQVVLHTAREDLTGLLLGWDYPIFTSRTVLGKLYLRDESGKYLMVERSAVRYLSVAGLPADLQVKASFACMLSEFKPGPQMVRLSYQANRISWRALYTLILDQAETRADLSAWASVTNESGKAYTHARLKLVAGDVARIEGGEESRVFSGGTGGGSGIFDTAEERTRSFFEYHLYTFPRPVSLDKSDTRRIELFKPVAGIALAKKYLYESDHDLVWLDDSDSAEDENDEAKVGVFIELPNTRKNKLGIAVPGGTVSIYKRDPVDQSLMLIGQNTIKHTPAGKKIKLQVGNAFDITGRRVCTKIERQQGGEIIRQTVTFALCSHKDQDVTVRIKEPLARGRKSRWTWDIISETLKHVQLDARTVAWDVPVKAGGETEATYTVQYRRVKGRGE